MTKLVYIRISNKYKVAMGNEQHKQRERFSCTNTSIKYRSSWRTESSLHLGSYYSAESQGEKNSDFNSETKVFLSSVYCETRVTLIFIRTYKIIASFIGYLDWLAQFKTTCTSEKR